MNQIPARRITILLALLLFVPVSALADRDRDHDRGRSDHRQYQERHDQRYDRDDRRPRFVPDNRMERQFKRDHDYPKIGHRVPRLPERRRPIRFHDHDYFFQGGIWYEPFGISYVVVQPPIGILVPLLPPYYSTLWIGDVAYYYANGVYYIWRPDLDTYEVVEKPITPKDSDKISSMTDKLFVYPKQGQSKNQQEDDRFACYQFGVKESGYDPVQPPSGENAGNLSKKREDYRRAEKACLEGKGYSVQ